MAATDLYPDRSAWYVDEIERLTGATPFFSTTLTEAYACVYYAKTIYHGVYASDMHEAIVALYDEISQTYGSFLDDSSPLSTAEVEYA